MQNRFLQLKPINGETFVIGDIHGKYTQLMAALEKVGFNFTTDRLISVGDLIDRGKENLQCLELMHEPWFHCVIGNHEVMMYDALTEQPGPYGRSQLMQHWTLNGGDWYYKLKDVIVLEKYCEYIRLDLPIGIEFTDKSGRLIGVTHAGLPRKWSWNQTKEYLNKVPNIADLPVQKMIWTRTRIQTEQLCADILGVDLLINGHTPTQERVWRGNNVFIDQGYHNPNLMPINVLELQEENQNAI